MAINKVEANGRTLMDLTADTVTPETLAEGVTAHDKSGAQITGKVKIRPLELGIRVDYVNKTFTRLGDAVGLSGGSDFDEFPMYKRRRCNLADNGTINAYLGDDNYAVDGSNGQVMVEQPKFYYKVIPIAMKSSVQANVVEYWISDEPLSGYSLHPVFIVSNRELDNIYIGAYESRSDKLSFYSDAKGQSISGVSPYDETADRAIEIAKRRGTGWRIETIKTLSAEQLLMLIEYGKFNMQEAIGLGLLSSRTFKTGELDAYGNGTYGSKDTGTEAVQWRGKENPWARESKHIDQITVKNFKPYILGTALSFSIPNTKGVSGSYKYISYFGYDSNFDWVFIPYGLGGNSSLPVGDTLDSNGNTTTSYSVASGGSYGDVAGRQGAFYYVTYVEPSSTASEYSYRLVYIN